MNYRVEYWDQKQNNDCGTEMWFNSYESATGFIGQFLHSINIARAALYYHHDKHLPGELIYEWPSDDRDDE